MARSGGCVVRAVVGVTHMSGPSEMRRGARTKQEVIAWERYCSSCSSFSCSPHWLVPADTACDATGARWVPRWWRRRGRPRVPALESQPRSWRSSYSSFSSSASRSGTGLEQGRRSQHRRTPQPSRRRLRRRAVAAAPTHLRQQLHPDPPQGSRGPRPASRGRPSRSHRRVDHTKGG